MSGLRSVALLALLLAAASVEAQTPAPRVVVEAGVVAQSYSSGADQSVSEVSVPLGVTAAVTSGIEVHVRTTYATVTGDALEDLTGIGDTQVGANLRRAVGGGLVDLSLTANLPTGQTSLNAGQFATSSALALDDYAFALPTLGRGTILAPGLTIALPLGPGIAVGAGAAYASSSSFTPFANDTSAYTPAGETILTAGFDASLGGASTVTLEGSYVLYGDDTYQGQTFSPGDKLAGTLRLALGSGSVRGRFLARYRQVADGGIGTPVRPVEYLRPNQARLALGLDLVQNAFDVGVTGGLRYYGSFSETSSLSEFASALTEQQLLLDVSLAPTIRVGPNAAFMGAFTYTLGVAETAGAPALEGTRASAGVRVGF